MKSHTQKQVAVRYGDGTIERIGSVDDALSFFASIRRQIDSGEYDADDYEPMTVVTRTVQIEVTKTPWAEVD